MAILSALRRFAKLGFWVGLSAGAMLVDACSGGGVKVRARDASPEGPTADVPGIQLALDAPVKAETISPGVDGGAVDADSSPADASQTDLWDIICE